MRLRSICLAMCTTFAAPSAWGQDEVPNNPAEQPKEREKVAVMPLQATGLDEVTVRNLGELMTGEIGKLQGYQAISADEIKDVVDFGVQQQALGCDDPKCLVDIGNALGASLIVTGSVGTVGETFVVSVKLIDIATKQVRNRVAETIVGSVELLGPYIRIAAWKLFEQPVPDKLKESYFATKERVTQAAGGASLVLPQDLEAQAPPPDDTGKWLRLSRKIATGVGVVGLLGGGAMHVVSFIKSNEVGEAVEDAQGANAYNAEDGTQKDAKLAQDLQTGAIYAYSIGGALLIGAIVLAILEPDVPVEPTAVRLVPTSSGLAVTF